MPPSTCPCGSGKECWELTDARGIFVSYVCDHCESDKKKGFRPEIFTDSQYEVDEPIDPEPEVPFYG